MSTVDTSGDNVKVICRVRPFIDREMEIQATAQQSSIRSVVEMQGKDTVFLDHHNDFQEKERFPLDFSIWSIPESQQKTDNVVVTQEDVFAMVGEPTLQQCWDGYNTCFFAYGQTGSGKTFTMMGPKSNPGIIPRLCKSMFMSVEKQNMKNADKVGGFDVEADDVKEYMVEARFLEIYNEKVQDLLFELNTNPSADVDHTHLKVRNFPGTGPDVVGITTLHVKNWEDCMTLIEHGVKNRTVAATKMNDESSRSHSIFKLSLTQTTKILPKKQFEKLQTLVRNSVINLVDLAGSERNKKSQARGQQLIEASAINKSLTCLKQVIDALVEGKSGALVPYRDSLLTWLLSESLGGNSKTFMMACVSPHYDNAEETLNTLRYALRTQGIQNRAQVNDSDEMKKMERLKNEMAMLSAEILAGGQPELQAELDATKAAITDVSDRLRDTQAQADDLAKALAQEKELKYAKALASATRIHRARRETAAMEEEKARIALELKSSFGEREAVNADLSSVVSLNNILRFEESKVLAKIEHQQMERNFWKDSSSKVETLKAELRETHRKKTEEAERKESEKNLAVVIATVGNSQLRADLVKRVTTAALDHNRRLDRVMQKQADDYHSHGKESCQRQDKLEVEIEVLQKNVKINAARLARETQDFQNNVARLEKDVAFCGNEIVEQNASAQKTNKQLWEKRHAIFEGTLEQLKTKISQLNNENQMKHSFKVADMLSEFERLEVDGQGANDDCARMGEQRLRSVNSYWERKVQTLQEEKRAELDCFNQLNAETEDFLRGVAMCERMQSISAEQVEAALQNPLIVNRGIHRSEYASVPPAVYSLSNLASDERPSISALTQQLLGDKTPRMINTSRTVTAAMSSRTPKRPVATTRVYTASNRDLTSVTRVNAAGRSLSPMLTKATPSRACLLSQPLPRRPAAQK